MANKLLLTIDLNFMNINNKILYIRSSCTDVPNDLETQNK